MPKIDIYDIFMMFCDILSDFWGPLVIFCVCLRCFWLSMETCPVKIHLYNVHFSWFLVVDKKRALSTTKFSGGQLSTTEIGGGRMDFLSTTFIIKKIRLVCNFLHTYPFDLGISPIERSQPELSIGEVPRSNG